MDEFEAYFGCTSEEYDRRRAAILRGALRGERCVHNERRNAGKDLFDFVRSRPNLCEAILFELERETFDMDDWLWAYRLRARRLRAEDGHARSAADTTGARAGDAAR